MDTFILNWLASMPIYAAPLLLASLGLIVNERAGVLNLGAEGLMAIGAVAGVIAMSATGSPWLAVAAAIASACLLALTFGLATVVFRTDQVLTGLILVAGGVGLAGVVGRDYANKPVAGLAPLDLGALSQIPWIGPILLRQDALIYVGAVLVIGVWWSLQRTMIGLRLRAVGEDPATADAAGIDVQLYRLTAVTIGGGLCGLAGAYLSLAAARIWVEGMVAGRGWIAIALVIFARWRPGRAAVGALLFGGMDALIPRVQAIGADVPIFLMMMLPYVATLTVLAVPAIVRGEVSAAPSALGLHYLRQERR